MLNGGHPTLEAYTPNAFSPIPSRKRSRELLFLESKVIWRVVNAITGHCLLNKHLTTMGYLDNPRCDCDLDDKTGFHLICECPRFSTLRKTLLGSYFLDPSDVPGLGPANLNKFLVRTNRPIWLSWTTGAGVQRIYRIYVPWQGWGL